MKWFLLALFALVVCSGQSCLQPFDRLAVNDELRAICVGYLDSEIVGFIERAESHRLADRTKADALYTGFRSCDREICLDCWLAIVDQVYDNAP